MDQSPEGVRHGTRSRGGKERLRLTLGGINVTVDVPQGVAPGQAMPWPDWLPFSTTELRIVGLMLSRQALSREQIASALDETVDGRIKGVLASLVSRKVLLVTGDGYQLNAPADARPALKEWVRARESAENERPG
jgi:hypothetical protein